MSENCISSQLNELFEQYDHIIGKQKNDNLSLVEIVQQIVTYYEDIINYLPGHVYWFNKDCIAIGANKNVLDQLKLSSVQEFKGLSYEEIRSKGGWGFEETEFFKQQSFEVLSTGKAKINIEEPPIPDANGNPTVFLSSRVPLHDHQENIIGLAGISIDITELKRTQQELKIAKEIAEHSSYLKSEFVTNMSHDLKTPLAGIISLSELLSDRLQGEEQFIAETLMISGKQLLNLLENCLKLFKLETSNILLRDEKFNLYDLLKEVKETFEPTIFLKKLEMTINLEANCPIILFGNRVELFRILSNLVSNAVKFTQKGFISITAKKLANPKTAKPNQALIEFSIKDSGIGIPEEWKPFIFEKFTRVTPSYKGIYEGHGIGLYIVSKFIKAMGGSIRVESKEQEGSTFIVTLAFKDGGKFEHDLIKKTKNKNKVLDHDELPTIPLRILIVEDNPIAQLMQCKLLSSMGHKITLASSGEEAVSIFESGNFDLIFMDLGLPGIQGDVASQLIRKKEKNGTSIPIIALTAHISEEMKSNIKNMHMDFICSKPLSRKNAKQFIQKVIYYSNK